MNGIVKKVVSAVGDFARAVVCPDGIKCIVCDSELGEDRLDGLCDKCELKRNTQFCDTCGRYLYSLSTYCNDCKKLKRGFDISRASIVMEGQAHKIIHDFKYGGAKWLAPYLAEYMLDSLMRERWDIDLIIPVPLFKKRERERGFNQSALLAREISNRLNIECAEGVLIRKSETSYLARMTRAERAKIIKGAFEVTDKSVVKGKSTLLVDDVLTTGSTADECATVLKKAKAERVYIIAFACGAVKISLM